MNKINQILLTLLLFTLSGCPQETSHHETVTSPSTASVEKLGFFKERQARLFDKLKTLPMYEAIRSEVIKANAPGAPLRIFEPMSDAITRDDVVEVNKLLHQAPYLVNREMIHPGKSSSDRVLPLIYAVKENKRALFDALVAHEATDLNISDKKSKPLSEAFLLNKRDPAAALYFLQELLAKGASPLVPVENGQWLAELPEFKAGGALKDIGDQMRETIDANYIKESWKRGPNILDYKPRVIKAAESCNLSQMKILANNTLFVKSFELIDVAIKSAASQSKNCRNSLEMIKFLMTKGVYPRKWQLSIVSSWPHLFPLSMSHARVAQEFAYRNLDATVIGLELETELYNKISLPQGSTSERIHEFLYDAWKSMKNLKRSSSLESPDLASLLATPSLVENVQKSMDFSRKIEASSEPDGIAQDIFDFSQTHPAVITAAWVKHGFSIVIFKNMVIKLNKGDRSPGIISGARIYSFVNSPGNLKPLLPLISHLGHQSLPGVEGKKLFDHDIDAQMGLVFKKQIEEPNQCIGNCSWESDASFGLQFLITILITPNWQNKSTDGLITTLSYEPGKIATEEFKNYATYYLVDQYVVHAENSLGQNRCVPETHMLALIVGNELRRGASGLGDNQLSFYGKKIISRILESGWHLPGLRKELDYEDKNNHKKLLLLLNHLGIAFQTFDDKAKTTAEALLEIFDPQKPQVGLIKYSPGRCY